MKIFTVLIIGVLMTGCAFKGIDTCGTEGTGNGCTPASINLMQAETRSNKYTPISNIDNNTTDELFKDIDKQVLIDEYTKSSPNNTSIPSRAESKQVKIRIYPYSDGERFYDTRDIYTTITKPGWFKGSYVYTNNSTIKLAKAPKTELPEKMVTTTEVNLRSGASTMFEILTTLKKRQLVKPEEYRNGWYKVSIQDKGETFTGWINGRYLK